MLCQKCGKNEAEVHLVQTVNGERTEALLCAPCAGGGFGTPISFTNFLQGFIDMSDMPSAIGCRGKESNDVLKCGGCGRALAEIKRTGKAGCARCYGVFKAQLEPIIKNAQAGNAHTGKYPKRAGHISVHREIIALKRKLAESVKNEEFEEAARLRDRIRALQADGDGESNEMV